MAILSEEVFTKSLSNRETHLYKLFENVATDETKSDAIDVMGAESVTAVVEVAAGVTAGVVKLEGAVDEDYAGTWAELGSITTNAGSKAFKVTSTDNVKCVRLRVETAISGGAAPSIDAYLIVRK
jgi:hypothetical protein